MSWQCGPLDARLPPGGGTLGGEGGIMWSWADRLVKAVSDATVGTVIVLVHVALADRVRNARRLPPRLS
jgi:hypothetical protein